MDKIVAMIAHFSGIIGTRQSAGQERVDDVREPITKLLLKWRDMEWFTTNTDVLADDLAGKLYRLRFPFNGVKVTRYQAAPGWQYRPNSDDAFTGIVECEVEVTPRGAVYVVPGSVRTHGGDGPSAGPIIGYVNSRNGTLIGS